MEEQWNVENIICYFTKNLVNVLFVWVLNNEIATFGSLKSEGKDQGNEKEREEKVGENESFKSNFIFILRKQRQKFNT